MKSLANKFIISFLFTHLPAFSANLLLFDNPALTIMQHGSEIKGHYVGRSNKSNLLGNVKFPVTCEFLFSEFYRTSDALQISAWENAIFMPDDPYLTYGLIRIHDGTWKIIFEGIPRGCSSKEDSDKLIVQLSPCCNPADLAERGGLYVRPTQQISAIGFRILNKSQAFITPDSTSAPREPVRIGRGSVVTALKTSKDSVYVRYVTPNTGEVILGWMKNQALTDPFKKAKSQ